MTYEQQRSQHCRDPDQHWIVADSDDPWSSGEASVRMITTEKHFHRCWTTSRMFIELDPRFTNYGISTNDGFMHDSVTMHTMINTCRSHFDKK